jgi:hypothetical protein
VCSLASNAGWGTTESRAIAPSAVQSARRFSRCKALASLAAARVPRPKIRVMPLCGGMVPPHTPALQLSRRRRSCALKDPSPPYAEAAMRKDAHPTTPTTQHGVVAAGNGIGSSRGI